MSLSKMLAKNLPLDYDVVIGPSVNPSIFIFFAAFIQFLFLLFFSLIHCNGKCP